MRTVLDMPAVTARRPGTHGTPRGAALSRPPGAVGGAGVPRRRVASLPRSGYTIQPTGSALRPFTSRREGPNEGPAARAVDCARAGSPPMQLGTTPLTRRHGRADPEARVPHAQPRRPTTLWAEQRLHGDRPRPSGKAAPPSTSKTSRDRRSVRPPSGGDGSVGRFLVVSLPGEEGRGTRSPQTTRWWAAGSTASMGGHELCCCWKASGASAGRTAARAAAHEVRAARAAQIDLLLQRTTCRSVGLLLQQPADRPAAAADSLRLRSTGTGSARRPRTTAPAPLLYYRPIPPVATSGPKFPLEGAIFSLNLFVLQCHLFRRFSDPRQVRDFLSSDGQNGGPSSR